MFGMTKVVLEEFGEFGSKTSVWGCSVRNSLTRLMIYSAGVYFDRGRGVIRRNDEEGAYKVIGVVRNGETDEDVFRRVYDLVREKFPLYIQDVKGGGGLCIRPEIEDKTSFASRV